MLAPSADSDEPKAQVDINTEKMRKQREEDEREEKLRAELEYRKHVREIHRTPDFDDDDDVIVEEEEEEEEEPATKRARNIGQQVDENWFVESSPDIAKEAPVPVMYKWEKEFESLRDLSEEEPELCFGCEYMSMAAHESIYAEEWRVLVEFFRESLHQCPRPRQFGIALYNFFERTVMESLREREPKYIGRVVWTPYGIFDHFWNHTRDPVVQMTYDYMAYTEIHRAILRSEMFEMVPTSSRPLVNDNAMKKLKIIADLRRDLMRTNPHQLPYAPKETSTGALTMHSHSRMKRRPNLAEMYPRFNS